MIRLLIVTLALASFAAAQTKHLPPEARAKTGYEKAEKDLFPKTASYDGKWTVDGFSILDAQGKEAFKWQDRIRAVVRIHMIVSWAPDSNRVVLIDQFNRGCMLYASEFINGSWRNVPSNLNLNPLEARYFTFPKTSLINRVSVVDWLSGTAVKIEDKFMVDDLPTTKYHWESTTEVLQFANGSLREVN